MGCFNVEVSRCNNEKIISIERIVHTPKLSLTNIKINPNYSVEYTPINISANIGIVCDINYGEPLYAADGSLFTLDGKVVYVRRLRV